MRVGPLLAALVVLAGCASPSDPPAGDGPAADGAAAGAGSGGAAGDGAAGDASPPSPPPGARPDWVAGQWWTWEVSSTTRPATKVTTVVAEATGDGYRVGLVDPEALVIALTTHVVPVGDVARDDLSWDAHGSPVALFDFPLADGKSWTTDLWFAPGVAVSARAAEVPGPADVEPGFTIVGLGVGESLQFRANWSSARQSLVSLDLYFGAPQPFDSVRLVDQGVGHTGAVQVPTVQSPVRTSTTLGAVPPGGAPPPPGRAAFPVATGATSVIFACFLGGAPGLYSAVATPPTGDPARCSNENAPADVGFVEQTFVLAASAGEWNVAYAAGGQGVTFVEAFVVTMDEAQPG